MINAQINHTQLWHRGLLRTANGLPDVDLKSQSQEMQPPFFAERILSRKKRAESDRVHLLLQVGAGEDVWFSWVPMDMVGNNSAEKIDG